MPKINLEDDNVVDVEITVLEMDAPLDDADYYILRGLYYLGKKFKDEEGFWINPGDISKWIEANRCPPITPRDIGIKMKKLGFSIEKRLGQGKFRYVRRERLLDLIEMYNSGRSDMSLSNYTAVKREVFECYLNGGDIDELGLDIELVKKASREFMSIDEEDAKKWLDGDDENAETDNKTA
jgi:hypothetical protein